jgi:hypothetical protein
MHGNNVYLWQIIACSRWRWRGWVGLNNTIVGTSNLLLCGSSWVLHKEVTDEVICIPLRQGSMRKVASSSPTRWVFWGARLCLVLKWCGGYRVEWDEVRSLLVLIYIKMVGLRALMGQNPHTFNKRKLCVKGEHSTRLSVNSPCVFFNNMHAHRNKYAVLSVWVIQSCARAEAQIRWHIVHGLSIIIYGIFRIY